MTKRNVDVAEAVALYADGCTLIELGARYGCSWMTVKRRLGEAGIEMRSRGARRSSLQPKERRETKRKRDKLRREAISQRPHDGPVKGIKWHDIAKRDHMRCQICGCDVDPNDRWLSERGRWCFGRSYPTIDHIVALANGGTDTYDNVQLTCKQCNSRKQDKGQLRMTV